MSSDSKSDVAAPVTFTVALPVRNGAEFLREALDSVLAQSHRDFEIVVSDNASTDATPQILAEYAARDPRVRVSRSEQPLGHAENVNRSVSMARNQWVKFICHDDLFEPDCLETLASVVRELPPGVGVVGNAEAHLYSNGVRQAADAPVDATVTVPGREWLRTYLSTGARVPIPALTNALVRKDVWEAAGTFDTRFSLFDIFLWTRILLKWDYAFVGRVLTVNRIHAAQVFVAARRTMTAVNDLRVFWPEFMAAHARELGLGLLDRLRVRLKPVSSAGAYIAMELLKKRPAGALRLMRYVPVWWWPVLPLAVLRSYRFEQARLAQLQGKVPMSAIFPG